MDAVLSTTISGPRTSAAAARRITSVSATPRAISTGSTVAGAPAVSSNTLNDPSSARYSSRCTGCARSSSVHAAHPAASRSRRSKRPTRGGPSVRSYRATNRRENLTEFSAILFAFALTSGAAPGGTHSP
ncbi:hypothetical protein GCM10009565_52860 [Amycolatopsis albidoflavus]